MDALHLLKVAQAESSMEAGQSCHIRHHIKLANGHNQLQSTNE